MRGIRFLLLIGLLLFGQMAWGRLGYVGADGRPCAVCPTLDHADDEGPSDLPTLQTAHGDCHDCCVLKAEDQRPDGLRAVALELAPAILPTAWTVAVLLPRPPATTRLSATRLYWPHGPPCPHPLRGPPVAPFGLSAGRE